MKETLGQKQRRFAYLQAILTLYAYAKGYEITFGDAYNVDVNPVIDYLRRRSVAGDDVDELLEILMVIRHKRGKSFHYKRLAKDLNLFKNGRYLTSTESHRFLGEFWESLNTKCTWGGRFGAKDGNHYSYGE